MALLRLSSFLVAALVAGGALAQEEDAIPPEQTSKPPVAITFTPPELEGDIVLGIFDAAGRVVRTLRFEPGAPELKIDTNGYIATWDGRDETGAACPAGRYAARGYVVGDQVSVEGEAFHFNDWMAEDRIPATGVKLRAWPDALGVEIATAGKPVFAKIRDDGTLEMATAPGTADGTSPQIVPPKLDPPPLAWAPGRDGSMWVIADDGGQHVVAQIAKGGSSERGLRVAKDEPQPVEVLASMTEDAILLKEVAADGRERVRMLRRAKTPTAADKDGRVIADWEVVFERAWQPCAKFGVIDGRLVADAGATAQRTERVIPLVENTLEPGKKQQLRVRMSPRHPGSALTTSNGLGLVEVSTEGDWNRFVFGPGDGSATMLYQGDGVVVEEFSFRHLDEIAAFDAGSFLLAPAAQ
jgi:hypothetical protein